MVIDFHTHIFSKSVVENRTPFLSDPQFNLLYESEQSRLITGDELRAAGDEAGISASVAMGFSWISEEFCTRENSSLAKAAKKHKGHLYAFGSVPLEYIESHNMAALIMDSVKEIKELQLSGVGEVSFYRDGFTGAQEQFLDAVLSSANDEGLPVCIHVNEDIGHRYPGKYSSDFSLLYKVIENNPGVPVILAHWGGGLLFYELMPEVERAFENVYYDTAASPFLYSNSIYGHAVRLVGAKKILFGSDYPLIKPERYLHTLWEWIFDPDDLKDVRGRNAAALLGLT